MIFRLIFFVSILLPLDSVQSMVIRDDKTIDQYRAEERDFPGVFYLFKTESGFFGCPITLIAPHWGITAAHCAGVKRFEEAMEAKTPYPVNINGVENKILEVFFHPSWTGDLDIKSFDLALLRLGTKGEGVTPYPLYEKGDEIGKSVPMVG